jgi:hypothetical protein
VSPILGDISLLPVGGQSLNIFFQLRALASYWFEMDKMPTAGMSLQCQRCWRKIRHCNIGGAGEKFKNLQLHLFVGLQLLIYVKKTNASLKSLNK